MKISVSSDERTHIVDILLKELERREHKVTYFGPEKNKSADWPDVTRQAAQCVVDGTVEEGIVLCWTGTGASIAANKVHRIRAALCHDAETAKGARKWNHANVLALSLRTTSEPILKEILDAWFSTPFTDDEWNLKQIEKIRKMEK